MLSAHYPTWTPASRSPSAWRGSSGSSAQARRQMANHKIRDVVRVGGGAGDRARAPRAQPRGTKDEEAGDVGLAVAVGPSAAPAEHLGGQEPCGGVEARRPDHGANAGAAE